MFLISIDENISSVRKYDAENISRKRINKRINKWINTKKTQNCRFFYEKEYIEKKLQQFKKEYVIYLNYLNNFYE